LCTGRRLHCQGKQQGGNKCARHGYRTFTT
jgi:hypothetical protein